MDNMIDEPSNSVVMVYINNNGEMSASTPQTQPTPEECYRMMVETT